jgi:hypothetical protein
MIKRFLQWALSKFDEKPSMALDLPVKVETKKPQVKRATTKTVAKKATRVVKKAPK